MFGLYSSRNSSNPSLRWSIMKLMFNSIILRPIAGYRDDDHRIGHGGRDGGMGAKLVCMAYTKDTDGRTNVGSTTGWPLDRGNGMGPFNVFLLVTAQRKTSITLFGTVFG